MHLHFCALCIFLLSVDFLQIPATIKLKKQQKGLAYETYFCRRQTSLFVAEELSFPNSRLASFPVMCYDARDMKITMTERVMHQTSPREDGHGWKLSVNAMHENHSRVAREQDILL